MVKSPCTSICAIDPKIGLCVGCKRTIKEITNWFNLSNMQKKKILLKIQDRKFFISNNRKKISKIEIFN